jgi:TPR repeat protein
MTNAFRSKVFLLSTRAQLPVLLLLQILLSASTLAAAQSKNLDPPPATDLATKPASSQSNGMTVDDVIKLSKAGLGDDIIIQQIKKRTQPFDLTPDQLIELKSVRVSDSVIRAMTGLTSVDVNKPSGNSTAPPGIEQQLWNKALSGDPSAQFSVSRLYYEGKVTPQDYAEAAAWMKKAAEQGYVAAEFGLAIMYENGQGLAQNQSQAVAW